MHLGEERAADHPPDESPQHQSNTDGADDAMPEASDQGLEANALAPNQQVVSAAKPHVRDDDPRRLATSHADHGEHHDDVTAYEWQLGVHRGREPVCSIPLEDIDESLDGFTGNIGPRGREVHAPGIPERNREQGEHGE